MLINNITKLSYNISIVKTNIAKWIIFFTLCNQIFDRNSKVSLNFILITSQFSLSAWFETETMHGC